MKYGAIFVCAAVTLVCGDSCAKLTGFTSKMEWTPYDETVKALATSQETILGRIAGQKALVPSRHEKAGYVRSETNWKKQLEQLFKSIDETITEMGSKKTLGIKLGLGGMDARDQQRVKDAKKAINEAVNHLFLWLKGGIKKDNELSCHLKIKYLGDEKQKLAVDKGGEKTIEIKQALARVLGLIKEVYSELLKKIPAQPGTKK